MIKQLLVRNYYERNGDFSGIERTSIATALQAEAARKGVSLQELCYQYLGYQPIELDNSKGVNKHFFSAEYVKTFRQDAMRMTSANLAKTYKFPNRETVQTFCKLSDAYTKKLRDLKVGYKSDSADERILYELIYSYYKKSKQALITEEEYSIQLYDWLVARRADILSKKLTVDDIVNEVGALKVVVDSVEFPSINQSTLFLPKTMQAVDVSKIEKEVIQNLCKQLAIIPASVCKDVSKLALLSVLDNNKYLQLLDIAAYYGMTYQDLLAIYGIKVPDQIRAYEELGCFLLMQGDRVFYLLDGSTQLVTTTSEEFLLRFSVEPQRLERIGAF